MRKLMKKLLSILILSILLLNTGYSLALAHHANEKYCFDCMHKYKIGCLLYTSDAADES